MNYIKIFQNVNTLSVSVGNSDSKDQLMSIFLDHLHQGGKYIAQIASYQSELRREGKSPNKNIYLLHFYRRII